MINAILGLLMDRLRAGAAIQTPWLSVSEAPEAVRTGQQKLATADGASCVQTPEKLEAALRKKEYPTGLIEEVFLVHQAEVLRQRTHRQPGQYAVRVWVEAYEDALMQDIERVTYRLYDDFNEEIVATEARAQDFELWMNVYGEFTVFAYVERKDKPPVWLTRYLDLPGRPPE